MIQTLLVENVVTTCATYFWFFVCLLYESNLYQIAFRLRKNLYWVNIKYVKHRVAVLFRDYNVFQTNGALLLHFLVIYQLITLRTAVKIAFKRQRLVVDQQIKLKLVFIKHRMEMTWIVARVRNVLRFFERNCNVQSFNIDLIRRVCLNELVSQ